MQFILQDTTNVPPDTKQNLHEDDEFQGNACSNAVGEIQKAIGNFYKDNSDIVWYAIGIVLLLGYFGYFGWSMYCAAKRDLMGDEETVRLIVMTIVFVIGLSLSLLFRFTHPDFSFLEEQWDRFTNKYGLM
jgi:hypothetical protein